MGNTKQVRFFLVLAEQRSWERTSEEPGFFSVHEVEFIMRKQEGVSWDVEREVWLMRHKALGHHLYVRKVHLHTRRETAQRECDKLHGRFFY